MVGRGLRRLPGIPMLLLFGELHEENEQPGVTRCRNPQKNSYGRSTLL